MTLTLNGSYVDMSGVQHLFTVAPVAVGGSGIEFTGVALGEGYLIGFTIRELSNTLLFGECYASVFLSQTLDPVGPQIGTIAGGYVARGSVVGWPIDRLQPASSLHVPPAYVTIPDPAAGAEIGGVLGSLLCHHVTSIAFTLTTSAAVAVRQVVLQFGTIALVAVQVPASATELAGITRRYWFIRTGALPANTATDTYTQLPEVGLGHNDQFNTLTTLIDVADQYSDIIIAGNWFQDLS